MRYVFAALLVICWTSAVADTVIPKGTVVHWVNVREVALPGPEIRIVGHLHPGESATFLADESGYYQIRLDDGVTGFVSKAWTERIASTAANIKIATFNIQVFGKTKASKPAIMSELASIVRKYDIVAVQEIKDAAGNVPTLFLTEINSDGSDYTLVVSERSGLNPDDANSQEQYAYYFNRKTVNVLDDAGLFDDSASDLFQREPYVARFGVIEGSFTAVLITVHTRPQRAVEETKALHDAFEWAKEQFPDEDDFIALGDFNASCDFANPLDFIGSPILDNYVWIIPDDADTNVSTSSACAYDRIVIATETQEDFADSWGIDTSITSNSVSDHFPVWAEFRRGAGQ